MKMIVFFFNGEPKSVEWRKEAESNGCRNVLFEDHAHCWMGNFPLQLDQVDKEKQTEIFDALFDATFPFPGSFRQGEYTLPHIGTVYLQRL